MTEHTITKLRSLLESDAQIARLLLKVRGPHGDAYDLIKLYLLAKRARKRVYWTTEDKDGNIPSYGPYRIIEIFNTVNDVLKRTKDFEWYSLEHPRVPLEDEPVFRLRSDDAIHGKIIDTEMYEFRELRSSKSYSFYVQ